jgi:malate synthase
MAGCNEVGFAGQRKLPSVQNCCSREETSFPADLGLSGANSTMDTIPASTVAREGFQVNRPSAAFDREHDLPEGFLEFLAPLHRRFAPRRQSLIEERRQILSESHQGEKPVHRFPGDAVRRSWRIELPEWCQDQRNQMTGPADDADLVVKMLNSGAPGVMLDLEDSMVNEWDHQRVGVDNILQALRGTLAYYDRKRDKLVGIEPTSTVIWIRPRGLHIQQAGLCGEELTPASLFDVARIVYRVDPAELKHPLCFYIPKSESAEEALWWRDLFQALAEARGWPRNYIKCMALVESHPLAFQMEEFLYNLREHILGLNLGRWDYMASLIHFNLDDPEWVLPDRNTIPSNVPFFQNLRELMPEICHKRGVLAIGGMTALYPSREDRELNARALAALEKDKKNEADCLMDGAWTGHPDQNPIALQQFPFRNQLKARRAQAERYPNFRPLPENVGQHTLSGTRAAVRTVIRYRNGVLNGKGASLLDGYMEDLATDRIYRLMIAQRLQHNRHVPVTDEGKLVVHTPELIVRLFDEELEKLVANPGRDLGTVETFREARRISEAMVRNGRRPPDRRRDAGATKSGLTGDTYGDQWQGFKGGDGLGIGCAVGGNHAALSCAGC